MQAQLRRTAPRAGGPALAPPRWPVGRHGPSALLLAPLYPWPACSASWFTLVELHYIKLVELHWWTFAFPTPMKPFLLQHEVS